MDGACNYYFEDQLGHSATCAVNPYLTCRFYREVKELADNRLTDGTGRKPHYRSLLLLAACYMCGCHQLCLCVAA